MTRLAKLIALFTSAAAGSALGGPIFLDVEKSQFVDFSMSVMESVNLAPGTTGYVLATLSNFGNASATFKHYDSSNPGGFGWSFSEAGLALGFGGVGFSPGLPADSLGLAQGRNSDPVGLHAEPDLSELSGVTLGAGESVTFTLFSLRLAPEVPLGFSFAMTTYVQLALGDPVYQYVDSDRFTVQIAAASAPGSGSMQSVSFGSASAFGPGLPSPISEPPTPALALVALGVVAATRRLTVRHRLSHQTA